MEKMEKMEKINNKIMKIKINIIQKEIDILKIKEIDRLKTDILILSKKIENLEEIINFKLMLS